MKQSFISAQSRIQLSVARCRLFIVATWWAATGRIPRALRKFKQPPLTGDFQTRYSYACGFLTLRCPWARCWQFFAWPQCRGKGTWPANDPLGDTTLTDLLSKHFTYGDMTSEAFHANKDLVTPQPRVWLDNININHSHRHMANALALSGKVEQEVTVGEIAPELLEDLEFRLCPELSGSYDYDYKCDRDCKCKCHDGDETNCDCALPEHKRFFRPQNPERYAAYQAWQEKQKPASKEADPDVAWFIADPVGFARGEASETRPYTKVDVLGRLG